MASSITIPKNLYLIREGTSAGPLFFGHRSSKSNYSLVFAFEHRDHALCIEQLIRQKKHNPLVTVRNTEYVISKELIRPVPKRYKINLDNLETAEVDSEEACVTFGLNGVSTCLVSKLHSNPKSFIIKDYSIVYMKDPPLGQVMEYLEDVVDNS